MFEKQVHRGSKIFFASRMKTIVSTPFPTRVLPTVRVQSHFPAVRIFILAITKEVENSPSQYSSRLARTIPCNSRPCSLVIRLHSE
jgi:hypothetical protein